jgi:hypothetical protein
MESRSFPSSFDIAGRYAKHREQHYLRYGEQGMIMGQDVEERDCLYGQV